MGEPIYLIVNAASRTGKAADIWQEVETALRAEGVAYEAHITEYAGHAGELADRICSLEGDKLLVVLGGDGTLNEVINGMHDFERVEMGYIPTGSANDFAKGAQMEGQPAELMRRILHRSNIRDIDIGEVDFGGDEVRRFLVSAGIGVDADVCRQALTAPIKKVLNKLGLGSLTYALLTVKTIFTMPFVHAHVTTDEGWSYEMKRAIFIAAMNFPYEGGGVPMAPAARGDDGVLTAFCAHDISRFKCFFYLVFILMGKQEGLKGIDLVDFTRMHIVMDDPSCVHADGEHCGYRTEVTYRCAQDKLRLRMPQKDSAR